MITKTVGNLQPQSIPMVLSNFSMGFTILQRTQDSVTATGPSEYWEMISLPSDATITLVQE